LVYAGNLRSFQLYGNQNHLCAGLLVLSRFNVLGTRTAFLAFFGQIDCCWFNLTQKNVFPVLLLNYAVFILFALNRGSGLFPGNHDDRNFISLKHNKIFAFRW